MVLDHGRIIERGSHNDLIKEKGTYYWFSDMGESFVREEEIRLETLVNIKISVEKYMKKLRHKEKESES